MWGAVVVVVSGGVIGGSGFGSGEEEVGFWMYGDGGLVGVAFVCRRWI